MGIHIYGCKIEVNQISKKEEIKLKEEKPIIDKRNIHLLTEGLIPHGTTEWESFSSGDQRKRNHEFQTKRLKLKNPIFSISPVRLAVYNIPFHYTQSDLKRLFNDTVKFNLPNSKPKIIQVKLNIEFFNVKFKG